MFIYMEDVFVRIEVKTIVNFIFFHILYVNCVLSLLYFSQM